MPMIPPGPARRFRTLVRKCQTDSPRGPDPPVLLRVADGQIHLQACLEKVALGLSIPTDLPDSEPMLVRLADLDLPQGPTPCEGEIHLLPLPDVEREISAEFVEALHEAWLTSAREPGKYALGSVQLRGKRGEIIATDGKQALIQSGFKLPFREDLLVPALPVFGTKDLARQDTVTVGKCDGRLVIRAGPWTVWLTVDAESRFPPVHDAIPKGPAPTIVDLDGMDAMRLADALAAVPCEDRQSRSVLFVLEERLTLWAWSDTAPTPVELPMQGCTFQGPPRRVAVRASNLERALRFRLRQIQFVKDSRPWVAGDSQRIYFAMPLDPETIPPLPNTTIAPPPETPQEISVTPLPPGRVPIELEPLVTDPLSEAENLRTLFVEAQSRLTRLIAFMKNLHHAPSAVVKQVVTNVRPLSSIE